MVAVEVFIFNGNGGVRDVLRQVINRYRRPVLVDVDFIEKLAISVHNPGRDGKLIRAQPPGRRQAGKNTDKAGDEENGGQSQEDKKLRMFRHGNIVTNVAKYLMFRNITVAGLPGAGSSTLGLNLAKELGWEYFSGGDFMRAYAVSKGLIDKNNKLHHPATVYGDDFDREVDYSIRERLQKDSRVIIDSWLSGFLAQGIDGVLKILMVCGDDAVRVDRIVNRDGVSVAAAKRHIFEREEKNLNKWNRMYQKEWHDWVGNGKIDFYAPRLYDLVIDTYSHDREATLNLVLKKLGRDNV